MAASSPAERINSTALDKEHHETADRIERKVDEALRELGALDARITRIEVTVDKLVETLGDFAKEMSERNNKLDPMITIHMQTVEAVKADISDLKKDRERKDALIAQATGMKLLAVWIVGGVGSVVALVAGIVAIIRGLR